MGKNSKRAKVFCILGTRPEAIKLSPVILGMQTRQEQFKPVVCVTGQHRDMLSEVLATFRIDPEYDLAIMRPNQTLADITAAVLNGVDRIIANERPDLVMVQGDTTTAFAGAVAAFYHRVPLAHVEAGLRTDDFQNPFPEEFNRVLIDRFAQYCFAPTPLNQKALLAENIPADRIYVTGNTGIDALLMICDRVKKNGVEAWSELSGNEVAGIINGKSNLALITAHRRESFGTCMAAMFKAIKDVASRYADWSFIYPVHRNPNVVKTASEHFADLKNVHLIEPLPYEPFVFLMNRASLILTDSGGIQEEALSLGKPVVVMRDKTERQEAVNAEAITLAGNTGQGIGQAVQKLIEDTASAPPIKNNPYGDGQAAERILNILWNHCRQV